MCIFGTTGWAWLATVIQFLRGYQVAISREAKKRPGPSEPLPPLPPPDVGRSVYPKDL